ncbi:uncharacterized protein FIBRA_05667 [Fibroporia radiculosa]|uniref:Glycoside hydrolase family 71 protein n=1 Tax=Fibroporia radiculosa TaxID=599839 RepID=J4G9W8_9APHY|nr:uncharacterized protein FIBRA_05667 [Fibroporia radiculosa]CCM03533.1 predicted protein [Fibroporia radiculosa]
MLSSVLLSISVLAAVAHAFPHSAFRHSLPKFKRASSSGKLVVAHHMVGNTYPYSIDNWASDISLAHSSGLDGFALNVGSDSWQPARVADAYQAALNSNTGFKLFISFDMSSLPCTSASDASLLRSYITNYATHPNQLTLNGQVFASTFDGSECTFGQSSPTQGWQSQFLGQLTGSNAVHFVPAFFVDPGSFTQFNGVMDGEFNWNGGWPTTLTTSSVQAALSSATFTNATENTLQAEIGTFTSDAAYVSGLNAVSGSGKTYIAAVSPWFFTHYSPQTFNKNWIYLADYWSYNARWETLVNNRNQVDIVELISWNDYGESHYVGPIEGAQPAGTTWATGFDHSGWLAMTNYYATAFRTGQYPAITEDQLYLWARPHPKDASATSDPIGKPTSYELTEDKLWAVVFATAPGTVTLSSGSSTTNASVPAGVTKLSLPLTPGSGMSGTLSRNGATVVQVAPSASQYTFNQNPQTYNYNAFVAYASGSGSSG